MKLYISEFNQKLELHFSFLFLELDQEPSLGLPPATGTVRTSLSVSGVAVLEEGTVGIQNYIQVYRPTHSQRLASMFVTAVTRFTLVIHKRWQCPLDIVWGSFPGGVQTGDEYFHRRVPVEIQGPSQLPDLQSEQARQIRSGSLQTFGQ